MLRRDISFTNPFTEQEVTETHYFHISKAELVRMELEEMGNTYIAKESGEELTGFRAKLQRMMDTQDGKGIMAEIEEIIRLSYGVRDGDKFRKNEQVWDDFKSSEAYSQVYFELCTSPQRTADFINAVIPSNMDQIAAEIAAEAEKLRHAEALGTKGDVPTAEAPAVEPATGTSQPADALPPEPEGVAAPLTRPVPRAEQIAQATPEHPVTLTQDEVSAMDSDELKSGVATGKYRLN